MVDIIIKSKKTGLSILTAILIITAFFIVRGINQRLKPVQITRFSMGTFFTLTIFGANADAAADEACQEILRVEKLTNSRNGPVAEINNNPGQWVKVPEELYFLLQQSMVIHEKTNGAFQPAIGALVNLWGFGYEGEGRLPKPEQIAEQVSLFDKPVISLDKKSHGIRISPGCQLDLGGVAKGYAVDRVYRILRRRGIRHALINGGDSSIRALGTRPWGKPWRIALAHPRKKEWVGVLQLPADMAVGTSADTQRYFMHQGKRYSHLINPRTGYPARDVILVSVLTKTAVEADMLSTAVFVSEGGQRIPLMEGLGILGYYVTPDGQPHFSKDFRRLIQE